ncbi:AMP-binding protein [Sphingomonas endophytica]|uniref:AMP-binding protein n=1 Tax=Sphingomonas endophytica TaxID=869719 RepID=UPI00315A4258
MPVAWFLTARKMWRGSMHPADHAVRCPAKAAIVMADSGLTVSYRELDEHSNASAWQLRALGLRRGDVIATLFSNAPEVFVLGWAAQRAGLYQTAISNKLSARDVAYILRDSGAKLLVVSPSCRDLAMAALAGHPGLTAFVWSGGTRGWATGRWRRQAIRWRRSRTRARARTCSIPPAPPIAPGG